MPDIPPQASATRGRLASFFSALTWRSLGVVVTLAVAVAVAINPFFATPFVVLLGRTVFIGLVLLLAFTAAGQWRQRWLPRWLAQLAAVALAAPLTTLAVYLLSYGPALTPHSGRLAGFLIFASSGLALGLVLALGALYRERDAQARSQALQFELERATLERQALDARLSLLQAQVEPHFLFNTLANVQALVETGSPRAAPVLGCLIAYLRAALPQLHEGGGTLGEEEARVRAYLELMQMRMPDRLQFELAIDPVLRGQRFPPLALLTLVENAVRHGIDPSEQGGRIEVCARRDAQGRVRVWVDDSGVGIDETASPGTGLANLRARLQGFFGESARLELSERSPRGVHAEVSFQCPT